ncbi:MarR family transcriptional regulator [Thalassospira lohafexi]|uniref:MarR family transcriptional regulator n=2 Tax=Thalassospira lohafexi TaxID=744227 RepID=A0A2N3LCM3_9PROT|nr:MarR family transcriptional regulator [Thalassospira lohafexi]
MMERILRPYDLGPTQWYVLYQLANNGPTPQRDFLSLLQIEKPTLSEVVRALVRKGFINQTSDTNDQRQRLLTLTDTGRQLWGELPDPIAFMQEIAFQGFDKEMLEVAVEVLKTATERLNTYKFDGVEK